LKQLRDHLFRMTITETIKGFSRFNFSNFTFAIGKHCGTLSLEDRNMYERP
jgi:hypothetical protein